MVTEEIEAEVLIPRKKRIKIFIIITSFEDGDREIIFRFITPWSQHSGVDVISFQWNELTAQQQAWAATVVQSTKNSTDPQVVEVYCSEEDSRLGEVMTNGVYEIEIVPVTAGAIWNLHSAAEGDLAQEVCDGMNGLAALAAG